MFLTSLVQLGDRESRRRNQASQLTVSAIDNERTGVINYKQKKQTGVCFTFVRSALVVFNKLEFAKRVVSDSESIR